MHTLHHSKTSSGGKLCVVYSLAYHVKQPCLLTAGSYGPVKVWKVSGWQDEEESE